MLNTHIFRNKAPAEVVSFTEVLYVVVVQRQDWWQHALPLLGRARHEHDKTETQWSVISHSIRHIKHGTKKCSISSSSELAATRSGSQAIAGCGSEG